MKRKMRLTRQYTVEIIDGVALLHHSPVFYYFVTAKKFHNLRRLAYKKLAQSGCTDIREVRGYSLWIDYNRDGFIVTTEPKKLVRDVLGIVSLWVNNVYNWIFPWRIVKLVRLLLKKDVMVGTMQWTPFVERFR